MPESQKIETYHIYPPINFARVGDSKAKDHTGFILGPEIPGCGPHEFNGKDFNSTQPVTKFKDADGYIKRQAARYRIYKLTETYETTSNHNRVINVTKEWKEVTETDGNKIFWTVELANRKGIGWSVGDGFNPDWFRERNAGVPESKLLIEPGPMTIQGVNQATNDNHKQIGKFKDEEVFLGELKTDAQGRLLVLGGMGEAGFVNDEKKYGVIPQWRDDCYYNNEGWYDDTSDGIITATVEVGGKTHKAKGHAWVIVGPPDYAPSPGVTALTTQYDRVMQIAKEGYEEERWGWEEYEDLEKSLAYPSFTDDIYPMIRRAKNIYWTVHPMHKDLSQFISTEWSRLSDNTGKEAQLRATTAAQIRELAEHLNYLELTGIQKTHLDRYEAGEFKDNWDKKTSNDKNIPGEQYLQKKRLDSEVERKQLIKAALDQAMGGGFHPGWEGGHDFVNIDHYEGAFRLKGKPGRFVENMAVPWQADLWGCRTWPNEQEDHEPWWPSHRPDAVLIPKTANNENPRFVTFGRADDTDDTIIGRQILMKHFSVLGFVLPKISKKGVWEIGGDLIELERGKIEEAGKES